MNVVFRSDQPISGENKPHFHPFYKSNFALDFKAHLDNNLSYDGISKLITFTESSDSLIFSINTKDKYLYNYIASRLRGFFRLRKEYDNVKIDFQEMDLLERKVLAIKNTGDKKTSKDIESNSATSIEALKNEHHTLIKKLNLIRNNFEIKRDALRRSNNQNELIDIYKHPIFNELPEIILDAIFKEFHTNKTGFYGKKRDNNNVLSRNCFAYLMTTGLGFTESELIIDGYLKRDRSTISYNLKMLEEEINGSEVKNPKLLQSINNVLKKVIEKYQEEF